MSFSRVEKGLEIARHGGVQRQRRKVEKFEVTDFDGSGKVHIVTHDLDNDTWKCDCEDFKYHGSGIDPCKHIWGAMIDERGAD